jgi:capsule polysaccharide export protein KpsE/RkpR
VKALPKPNLVQLSCEDFDSRFVQDMLSYFASYGNEVFRRVNASSATEEVRFLVRRVDELRQEADRSASLLREFQEQHQIVDLDTQAKAVVSTLAALNAQRISKQLELDLGRQFSSSDEPAIRQLESQLWVVEERMRDLKGGTKGSSGTEGARDSQASDARRGLFPAALAVPSLRAKYEILYRDRRVGEAALLFALERLEGARANEARDVSTYQVLDPPALATRHSRPKRLPFLVGSALLGFVLSVVVEAWRNRRPTVSA